MRKLGVPHERETTLEFLSAQYNAQGILAQSFQQIHLAVAIRIAVGAAIPNDDLAGAVVSFRNRAFEILI